VSVPLKLTLVWFQSVIEVEAELEGELTMAYTALQGHPEVDLVLSSVFAIWRKPQSLR